MENIKNVPTSYIASSKQMCRFDIFFELLNKSLSSKTELEELIDNVFRVELQAPTDSVAVSIDQCHYTETSKIKLDHYKAIWKKHLSIALCQTSKNYINNISLNNSNIINNSIELKKMSKFEKDFKDLGAMYSKKIKEIKELVIEIHQKNDQILRMTQVIDDFNQVISLRNKEIKRLKDSSKLERLKSENTIENYKSQLDALIKCIEEYKASSAIENQSKSKFIAISDNLETLVEDISGKEVADEQTDNYSMLDGDNPKESLSNSSYNLNTFNLEYLPKVINSIEMKILKPSCIPDLKLDTIFMFNSEFQNGDELKIKQIGKSVEKSMHQQIKKKPAKISSKVLPQELEKSKLFSQINNLKSNFKGKFDNSRNMNSISHSKTVNSSYNHTANQSSQKLKAKPNITLMIDLKDIESPNKPTGDQGSSLLSKVGLTIPNSKLQSYQKVSDKIKPAKSNLSQGKLKEGTSSQCDTYSSIVNTSINLSTLKNASTLIHNNAAMIEIRKASYYKGIPKRNLESKAQEYKNN